MNTGTTNEFDFENTGLAYAYDTATGLVMANMTNNNSFDYGCTAVNVSRAGTGAQGYNGSSLPNHVTDKTFTISPANTTGSGDTTLSFYFSEAEIAGWETATGLSRTALVIARGNASTVTETSAVTIGSFGTNVILTGSFTGLDGTYYFGPAAAFVSGPCAGGLKTWNGSWSPTGAPDNTNEVVIAANYDTAVNGDIDACTLTINGGVTLTVGADDYASVEGDITVNGTLDVVHTGSIVQVDAAAVTTNNGAINVNLTTPVLGGRDYTILGSPMSLETNAVFTGAWRVLGFTSMNFVPHPGVAPGGTNWADDNGDFYNPHTGVLNPGEGYLVRPQANNTGAPTSYDYTFDTGTLNSGDITYVADNNGIANGTPQVIANPYASAISASDFMTANPSIGAIYFWEHLTQPTAALPGPGGRDYDMDDISIFNASSDMGMPAANDVGNAMGTSPNLSLIHI